MTASTNRILHARIRDKQKIKDVIAKVDFMANSNLHNAKRAKQDEFYTQWEDIEREMNAYLEYDPDVFKGDPKARTVI